MTTFAQKNDADNGTMYDIYMDSATNQIAIAEDEKCYATVVEDALRTLEGEIQLNTELGVPYMRTVFRNIEKIPLWMHYVREKILEYTFVNSVDAFTYDFNPSTKVLTCNITINTDIGDVTLGVNYTQEISDGGEDMSGLIQDGLFYLPVHKTNGIQYYRILTDLVNEEMGVTTRISDQLFIKVDGVFVEAE